jgi:hypothetical protein
MAGYLAGNKVRLSVAFTDANGAAIDPTSVSLKYQAPGQAAVTQAYNPGNILRDSAGNYHYDLDTTGLSGAVYYEWTSTGTGQAATAGELNVTPLPV